MLLNNLISVYSFFEGRLENVIFLLNVNDFLLQQVKDRTCLRALEKIKIQLEKGNREYGEQTAAEKDDNMTTTDFQNEDGNNIVTWIFIILAF